MFNYESELVEKFLQLLPYNPDSVIINEMDTRHGNIDVVKINSYELPFNNSQIEILSKLSNSKIFTYLNNNRFLLLNSIIKNVGLSKSTIKSSLNELLREELIIENQNRYRRKKAFNFPKAKVWGFEAKLNNFQKAYYQAIKNLKYVDYSYMVFPLNTAIKIEKKYFKDIKKNNIGLIGVSENEFEILIKAKKTYTMNDSVRLLNLSKSNNFINRKSEKLVQIGGHTNR